jgi:hypothetical protein
MHVFEHRCTKDGGWVGLVAAKGVVGIDDGSPQAVVVPGLLPAAIDEAKVVLLELPVLSAVVENGRVNVEVGEDVDHVPADTVPHGRTDLLSSRPELMEYWAQESMNKATARRTSS